jgi:hypothetical protein
MATSTGIISNYLANLLVRNLLMNSNIALPNYYYVTLYSNSGGAGDSDAGTEVTTGAYNRHRVQLVRPTGIQIENNVMYNIESILFEEANSPGWGTIYGWGIKDASSGGNLLFWGLLDTPITVLTGYRLRIGVGDLRIDLSQTYTTQGGWTVFGANAVLNYLVNRTTFDWTASGTYLALGRDVIVNNSTDNLFSTWTEISTINTGYSRRLMGTSAWNLFSGDYTTNSSQIVFTTAATADWGILTDVVLYDSVTQNNPLFWGRLPSLAGDGTQVTPITVDIGNGFNIPASGLQVRFS